MPVSGVEHRDAGTEIDEAPAVDVPQLGALGAIGKHWVGGGDAARNGCGPAGLER